MATTTVLGSRPVCKKRLTTDIGFYPWSMISTRFHQALCSVLLPAREGGPSGWGVFAEIDVSDQHTSRHLPARQFDGSNQEGSGHFHAAPRLARPDASRLACVCSKRPP